MINSQYTIFNDVKQMLTCLVYRISEYKFHEMPIQLSTAQRFENDWKSAADYINNKSFIPKQVAVGNETNQRNQSTIQVSFSLTFPAKYNYIFWKLFDYLK